MNGRIMDTPLGQGETKAKCLMEGRACEAEIGTGHSCPRTNTNVRQHKQDADKRRLAGWKWSV